MCYCNMKEKILDAAANLIEQYGLRKFTVNEIASTLKISKKTIYKYFNSKEEIIQEYFEILIASDKNSVLNSINSNEDFLKKIYSVIHSNHQYRLPLELLNEARLFYPDEWNKIEEFKDFKLNVIKKLLKDGLADGIIKADTHSGILSKMLEQISDMFIDCDFLIENKLKASEAIDEALKIILNGILVDKKR